MGKCPHCGSKNIRRRYREHRRYKWRCRSCNRVFRSPKRGGALWLIFAAVVVLAVVIFTVQQDMISLPPALSPIERQIDQASEAVIPNSTPIAPVATLTTKLQSVSTSVAENAPKVQATMDASARSTVATVSVAIAATSTPTVTPTGIPADTPVPTQAAIIMATATSTAVPSPTHTSTSTPVPTATPTATPMPINLVLDTEATVRDYWSDGTANIDLTLSLRNEGSTVFQDSQLITVSCAHSGNAVDGCNADTEIALADGFGPIATNLTLRVPMGMTDIEIGYGDDKLSTLQVNVPERILGVDRDIWECYSDRAVSNNAEGFHRCYGWHSKTVEKWRSDSTVKVWTTGNANYIRAFRETLDEQLAPALNLNFEWVDDELEADFVAILGVSNSDELPNRWPSCVHYWGCAGTLDVKNGEVRSADLIIYHLDLYDRFLNDYPILKRNLNGVIIHEALHALAPTGHADRDKVTLSVTNSAGYLTYIDKAILQLNSHPLVEPGMTMAQVGSMIVFKDEMLDEPQEEEPASYDLLDYTLVALQKVDTVRMKIKGGRTGGRCKERFGIGEWATLEIGGFDSPDDPRLAYLRDGNDSFFIFNSGKPEGLDGDGWHHWYNNGRNWKIINREELWGSTAWWVRNSKAHHTITELLWHYDENIVEIVNRSDGKVTLSAEYNPSETSPFGLKDEQLTFTMVIDEDSYEIKRFEWIHHNRDWDYCNIYTEEAKDIEYGVDIEIPDVIVEGSKYALPVISTGRE